MKSLKSQIQFNENYAKTTHTEDCMDANDDTSVLKGRCICPKSAQHTPTPWHTEQARDGHFMIHETEGKSGVHEISLAHVKEERNAAFIVQAVNAHNEFIQGVKLLLDNWDGGNLAEAVNHLRVVMEKAEGK